MKFTYLNYGDNILRKLKASLKTIIVFPDYALKNFYLRKREKNILVPEGKIFTLEEFQKKIFKTDKMILTEAKRPLTLYKVLNKELKEKLNIQNYYDIIDFADLFFKYYRELSLAMKQTPEGLQSWQREYVERFEALKKEYDKYLEKNGFIPSDWIENIDNYDSEFLRDYDKIIFVDIPYFSPLMKKVIEKIEKEEICNIEIMVQIPQEDYNEKELKIERVSLVKENINCVIYENSDEISELVNLINLLRKEKSIKEIFSPVAESNRYCKIFPKYFIKQKLDILDDTRLYKFMKVQNQLLLSLEPRKRKGIPVEELRQAFDSDIFRKIYGITDEILEQFKLIFNAEYKYIDGEVLQSDEVKYLLKNIDNQENSELYYLFVSLYSDLLKIQKYKTPEEFIEYLKEIGFEKFRENKYLDITEKFYQAMDNIKSSERLCGKNGFAELFGADTGTGLYTLLIKYMEGIEIREIDREKEELLGSVKALGEARLKLGGTSYFIDIDNISLPGNLKDGMIFTESQRAKNGFMTFEEKKLIAKYRFIQGLFNCKESVVFVKNIPNEEIGKSQFLDEVMIKYNLSVKKNELNKDDIFEIIKSNFLNDKFNDKEINISNFEDYFILKKENTDFKDGKMILGTYDLMNIRDCRYRYFMDKIAEIHSESEEEYGTSMRFLGIVTHKIFDDISKKVYMDIRKNNNYVVDEKLADDILQKALIDNSMKIPTYMDLFFKDIMFPKIKENLFKFYREIERDINGKKVNTFFGEKSGADKEPFFKGEIDVFINGRADLVAETEEGTKYIIDYKTGGRKAEQLDIYSIIMYGDENVALKRIYNVIKGEYEKIDKTSVTKSEIENLFAEFMEKENYTRAEKKSACINCEYKEICRRELDEREGV